MSRHLSVAERARFRRAIALKSDGQLELAARELDEDQAHRLWRGLCAIYATGAECGEPSPLLSAFEQAGFRRSLHARTHCRLSCTMEPMPRARAVALWCLVQRVNFPATANVEWFGHRRAATAATLLVTSLPLAACASIWGGNVKGSFSCSAPGGTCAPSTVIDDSALALIQNARPMTPAARPWSQPPQRGDGKIVAIAKGVAHRERRILKVVFPAFVDQRGNLHEPRIVHAVADQGGWMQTTARSDLPALAMAPRQNDRDAARASQPELGSALPQDQATAAVGDIQPAQAPDKSGLPDPARVAAARALARTRLPTTPAEIKAAVDEQLMGRFKPPTTGNNAHLPAPDAAAEQKEPNPFAPSQTEAGPTDASSTAVNAPAAFPGRVEP